MDVAHCQILLDSLRGGGRDRRGLQKGSVDVFEAGQLHALVLSKSEGVSESPTVKSHIDAIGNKIINNRQPSLSGS